MSKTNQPDWYWTKGLHDASILSIIYHQLDPDWKAEPCYYNSMEIALDSTHALFETDIVAIRLYNCKLHSKQILNVRDLWWYEDSVRVNENGKTNLLIVLQNRKGEFVSLNVDFELAEVMRKRD